MANVVQFQSLSTAKQSEWIDRLFSRLWAMYGNKFSQMWAGLDMTEVKETWRDYLAELSQDEIRAGVDACKTREWPPTLPEFVKLCRPAIDYERAFYDAVEQMQRRETGEDEWTTAAIYWAASSLGNDLKTRPYSEMKARWAKALDDAIKAVKSGARPGEVPQRLEALPAPGESTLTREQIAQNVEKLKSMLSGVSLNKTIGDAA
jgi:hypothetical protein